MTGILSLEKKKKVNILNDNNNNLYKNTKLPPISSSKINLKPKLPEIILKNLIKNLPKKIKILQIIIQQQVLLN